MNYYAAWIRHSHDLKKEFFLKLDGAIGWKIFISFTFTHEM
jgi:hypothetical protein